MGLFQHILQMDSFSQSSTPFSSYLLYVSNVEVRDPIDPLANQIVVVSSSVMSFCASHTSVEYFSEVCMMPNKLNSSKAVLTH